MSEPLEVVITRETPRTTRLTITYHTPEWSRSVAGLGSLMVPSLWLAGTGVLIAAAYHGAIPLPPAKTIVVVAAGSAIVFWVAWNLDELMQRRQQRRGVRTALEIRIAPNGISSVVDGEPLHVDLSDDITFTTMQHRAGKTEGRDEQRVKRRLGYAYRDAWEIWLQSGHRIERLAAVADEPSARAIVRHLQEANEMATRGRREAEALQDQMAPR